MIKLNKYILVIRMIFTAKSIILFPDYYDKPCSNELSDEIILPSFYLNRLLNEYPANEYVYLVEIINIENNKKFIVSIGTPHFGDRTTAFVPDWIINQISSDITSDIDLTIRINKLNNELPVAKKLVIKPLDRVAFDIDITKCFESAFLNLHVLHEGIMIPVKIPEMGDYEFYAYIEKVEPEAISKVVNGEVEVEFIRDFEDDKTTCDDIHHPILPDYAGSVNSSSSLNINDSISESISEHIVEEIPLEERKRRVRESWLNRFR